MSAETGLHYAISFLFSVFRGAISILISIVDAKKKDKSIDTNSAFSIFGYGYGTYGFSFSQNLI